MRRYLIVFITLFFVVLHAQDMQYSKIFYEQDANIYDAIYYLTITHGEALLSNKRPQSQAQLFNSITDLKLENMDDLSLRMHSVILGQLYGNYLFETEYLKFDTNLKLAFQLNGLYHPEYAPYHDRFASYNSMLAPLTVPLKVLISNYCYFYTDIVIEKNFAASELSHTYINIPFFQRDLDYHFPKRAGMSIGGSFFNLSFARGPFNVGRSLSGSMLIADTADRLDYFNASIFVKNLSFDINIFQLQHSRFVFMHEVGFRILKKASITFHEGLLVNSYFDPRYLNPFMIMHNHAPWHDPWQRENKMAYRDDVYTSCQFGITADVVPIKNLRLYGQFGMNQFQTPSELKGDHGDIPNGRGVLFGAEWVQPLKTGYLIATCEGVYAEPWFYIGQNKYVSFTHYRKENVSSLKSHKDSTINIWLANPYGPDTISFFARIGFHSINKWKVNFLYRLVCKGENEASFFDSSKEIAPNIYYPSSGRLGIKHFDWAKWKTPSGKPIYFNTLKIDFFYNIWQNLNLRGEFAWTIVNGKISGHGINSSISVEYSIK